MAAAFLVFLFKLFDFDRINSLLAVAGARLALLVAGLLEIVAGGGDGS